MHTKEENIPPMTGTVEWFNAERGVGAIRTDDNSPHCVIHATTLRACGIDALSPGDRIRFRVREKDDERTATNVALLLAEQQWENEGGAVRPDDATGT